MIVELGANDAADDSTPADVTAAITNMTGAAPLSVVLTAPPAKYTDEDDLPEWSTINEAIAAADYTWLVDLAARGQFADAIIEALPS
ncbi:hypothetical protein [Tsukamurella soli]|uniref:hypothetical protein n=1 Tax=Tsukamurella soli TaxID=644556 RepID=UPI00360D86DF